MIIAPTLELAAQIKMPCSQSVLSASRYSGGDASFKQQVETLMEKPAIVVGTPAQLAELCAGQKLKTEAIDAVVFGEADRLVQKSLREPTKKMRGRLPETAQGVACSATITAAVAQFVTDAQLITLPPEIRCA